jgi:nicotinate-nucleotide adenylyltransferase
VERVGIFGGTFDPPHVGHVAVAADVADALGLDRVLWIPAREPPHKPVGSVSPPEVRLAMVRAAAACDPRFEVETLELEREGPSYTVDTVQELRRRMPDAELFLLLGADQARVFGSWRNPEGIAAEVCFAVMDRGGASGVLAARGLPADARTIVTPVRRFDVSSTDVRARARQGLGVSGLVPPGVGEIIERERLYSAP